MRFEALCAAQEVSYERLPVGAQRTPDYEIFLGGQRVIVEVKQLDPNKQDKEINHASDSGTATPNVISPTQRLRRKISDGYKQLKSAARKGQPCLLVLYNNAGLLAFIDSFAITTAMFGTFGVRLGRAKTGEVREVGRGFMENRRLTRNTCKVLSAIGVLDDMSGDISCLKLYHNPFALVPIEPAVMGLLAISQFRHPDPHNGMYVCWEPSPVEAGSASIAKPKTASPGFTLRSR